MKPDPDDYLPLAPATLHILLSLAGEPMHGYGIMQEVLGQSGGRYNLGPGTLYDTLQRVGRYRQGRRRTGFVRAVCPCSPFFSGRMRFRTSLGCYVETRLREIRAG